MPATRKPELYQLRKATGEPLTTDYARYTTEQLESELRALGVDIEGSLKAEEIPAPAPEPQAEKLDVGAMFAALDEPAPAPPRAPVSGPDPNEMPGMRLNTQDEDEPIRVDEQGRLWYQEEVKKPAYPKPRGRRVLKYLESGVRTETVQNGEYVETFEVAGVGEARPAEIKITLPSYQVGIYKDPRFPFKIHTYDGRSGFNLFEVQRYWGGSELVPPGVKRVYIENDLCYDIRSVVLAIQAEHRQLQLTGRL
jgi:hypothetical protein